MKIELSKIKYAAFASQETNCFTAEILIDGVKAGSTGNEGHGGPNWYDPQALYTTLNTHAKTLPPIPMEGMEPMEQNADILIGDLFDNWLIDVQLKKALKKFCVTVKGKKGVYTQKTRPAKIPADVAIILNDLPFEEARKVFLANQ
jgi:hypothetical protein